MSSSLVWEGKKECEGGKIGVFFKKKNWLYKIGLLCSLFLCLLFFLKLGFFWGEEFHSSNTTLINRSEDLQVEIG